MADKMHDKELAAGAAAGAPAAPGQAPDLIEDVPPPVTSGEVVALSRSTRLWRFLKRSPKLVVGASITLAILLFVIVVPFFVISPTNQDAAQFLRPLTPGHPLGTNNLGEDILSQLANGGRGSLTIGFTAGLIAITLSLLFGVLSGYLGGWTDEFLFLFTNIMLVIPGLPLMIVISGYLPGRTTWMVALVLGITGWAGSAIVLRSQAKSLRSRDYVAASRVAGEKPFRIIVVEILPNLLPLLAGQFLFALIMAILGEAGLSYLGLGPTGSVTWGTMLNGAQSGSALTQGIWWWFVPPGLLIAGLAGALSLVNFSIDEIINPKLRQAPAAVKNVRKYRKAVQHGDVPPAEQAEKKVDA